MPLEVITIPCLTDNYAYVLHDPDTGATALIDAPAPEPIMLAMHKRKWRITDILITHHHDDHIAGVNALRVAYSPRVIGAEADRHRLPPLDLTVKGGDKITVCGHEALVIDVPGHTVGHVAFHFPELELVFTADSLMAMGCGRLFEGTAAQMWESLCKLRALPPDTLVFSGHEYTEANARFAATIEPDNADLKERTAEIAAARAKGHPTVPSVLEDELLTNPFLRADQASVKAALGMADAADVDVFAEIRARKDKF
jgi:hydroxyacylglutathione hydrolase